jgi:antagonist of KipI
MSIKIIKKGLSDSIQDNGRYGYQHLGIQPSGSMDFFSAWLANKILGNDLNNPVFELHFPTSKFLFESDYTICITGANFVPVINEKSIELNKPIQVNKNDVLSMLQPIEGRTCYLSINSKFNDATWLGSYSYSSQLILKDQEFDFSENDLSHTNGISKSVESNTNKSLIEEIHKLVFNYNSPIRIIPGPAWSQLNDASLTTLLKNPFVITAHANRMGFTISGTPLKLTVQNNFLSSAVTRGTLQLLPNGEIIVLMADHQTIGGYANLGQIILVDLPRFAQFKTGQSFHFELTSIEKANQLYRNIYEKFQH